MRRVLAYVVVAALLAVAAAPMPIVSAQQPPAAADQQAKEFADLYQRWQRSQDTEERIALGEQAMTLEPALTSWPLPEPREFVRADLAFGLGSAYVARTRGVRTDNLEKAISRLEAALAIWIREAQPQDWAMAHNNVGIAYWGRIRGERADNQERAIVHFEAALTVFSREAAADRWAQLQNNLAVVYFNRTYGERAANLETAIEHFEAALTVMTREANAYSWAQAQNNLGSAYRVRIRGDRAEHREKAIEHLEAALGVFTREAYRHEWAQAQNNLALAHSDRIRGDRAENWEKAIAYLEAGLTVFNKDEFPQEWAQAQSNLGVAYASRIRGEPAANRGKAIAAFESALTIFQRDTFPRDHMRTQRLLGREQLKARDWRKAGPAYGAAREAFLLLFGQGLEETEAATLISEAGPLFAEAAFAALQRGETEVALGLANEGRARMMAVALKLQQLDLSAAERKRLEDVRHAIRVSREAIETAQGSERAAAFEKLVALRGELLALVKSAGDAQSGSALTQARALAAPGGAVVMPILTDFGGKVMVVTSATDAKGLVALDLPELTSEKLYVLLRGPRNNPQLTGWLGAYLINYMQGADQDQRWPEWLAAVGDLGPELWRLFAGRLNAVLRERGIKSGARLVWLPAGALGILPLGLAQDPASQRRLADDYEIVYGPSLDSLTTAAYQIARTPGATLVGIINPTGDLPGTEKEGAIVASHFARASRTLLERDAATPEAVLAALKGKTHWHFASHGSFSWLDPRQSALIMSGRSRLSVGRLLDTDGLGRPRLVVMSACETGLYDIGNNPDEFIGLPGTFTALGASGVLGTLWPVSDAATALLIAKFYELHIDGRLAPPTALRRAQAWLREATSADFNAYAKVAEAQGRLQSRQAAEIEEAVSPDGLRRSRNRALVLWDAGSATRSAVPSTKAARPYAHPYFWAGFIHTGL